MRPQRRCLCKVEEINTKKKIQCFPINVTLFGPIKSVTLSNCHIILQFSGYGIPFQLKNCHIKQFVTLSSVTISGKHCSKISFIISHNSVQVLSTPRLQHAVHLRHGRVRDGDGDEGDVGGGYAEADRGQVPRHPRRGLRVVRHLVRPLWAHHHEGADQVSVYIARLNPLMSCPRILEHRSRFSDFSSADFGPRLPSNQLYNNQKIDLGTPKSGVSSFPVFIGRNQGIDAISLYILYFLLPEKFNILRNIFITGSHKISSGHSTRRARRERTPWNSCTAQSATSSSQTASSRGRARCARIRMPEEIR